MSNLLILATIVLIIGLLAICNVSSKDILDVFTLKRKKSLKHLSKKRELKLVTWAKQLNAILIATGQAGHRVRLIILVIFLAAIGLLCGAFLKNLFLSPVLAIGLAVVPLIYIQLSYISYKHHIVEELEVALSIVTSSYERSENIILAFKENIEFISPPISDIFSQFVFSVENTNMNICVAIENMKHKLKNFVFKEWCDTLSRCVTDRNLSSSLRPIVIKLTDIKVVTDELKTILYNAKRTFWQLAFLSVVMIFVGFYLLPQGFSVPLVGLIPQLLLAFNIALLIYTSIKAIIETRDINFK